MEQEIKLLIKKRGFPRGNLTKLEALDFNTLPPDEILVYLEVLEKIYSEFKEFDQNLAELDETKSEIIKFTGRYATLKAKLRRLSHIPNPSLTQIEQQLNDTMTAFSTQQKEILDSLRDSSQFTNTEETVTLPKIEIPYFYGKRSEEFQSFKDLFQSIVHNNANLSNCQKLTYLKRFLKGDAYTFVRHVMITNGNYEATWSKVCDRYDKPAQIVSSFIKRFLEQGAVQPHSTQSLRKLCDLSLEVIDGLKALGSDAEKRDVFLNYIILNKLDTDTRTAWANKTVEENYPTFSSLLEFLDKRCTALENCEISQKRPVPQKPNQSFKSYHAITSDHSTSKTSSSTLKCRKCSSDHRLSDCPDYNSLNLIQRRELVAKVHCCFNCLGTGHSSKNCISRRRCFVCKRKHHTSLHSPDENHEASYTSSSTNNKSSSDILSNISLLSCPILPTAKVNVLNSKGQTVQCRILFDSGSNGSLISEACVQRLNLSRQNARYPVKGIASKTTTRGCTSIQIYPHFNPDFCLNLKVYIIEHLASNLPKIGSNIVNEWDDLKKITLADPLNYESSDIDIVMGVGHFFKILEPGQYEGPHNLICQNTSFGWIIGGGTTYTPGQNSFNIEVNFNIDQLLRNFWQIEEVIEDKKQDLSNNECEQIFCRTTQRTSEGRFIVNLPFLGNAPLLGESLAQATSRFLAIERKLQSNNDLREEYVRFMKDYLELNHMEELTNDDLKVPYHQHFYLPHHPVIRDTSLTTKVRVVFDGSAKSRTSTSLNDILLVGPTVQCDLIAIIMRFRLHAVAFTADIEKMYRQIRVNHSQCNYQRILWREHPSLKLKHYKLTTVTYGTGSAPFLATRCLQQLAKDFQHHPEAAKAIENDFYVDDLLSGNNNVTEAIKLALNIDSILKTSGFTLLKWASNSSSFMDFMSNQNSSQAHNHIIDLSKESSCKVLGLHWIPETDIFLFKVNMVYNDCKLTKRKFLSDASRLFDPLGWLSPTTILIKIMFQQLWLLNLNWDDVLPPEITDKWMKLKSNLKQLEEIKIPRYMHFNHSSAELHGFCDSSKLAYAAVIYLRSIDKDGKIQVNLITSKSRVAPIKPITIPRLELCGALLLARLTKYVKDNLNLNFIPSFSWSDSQIVLHWLSQHPTKWPTFISNRTAQIHDLLPNTTWRHVDTKTNPSDYASRGLNPKELSNCQMWWNGPPWLQLSRNSWPNLMSQETTEVQSYITEVTQISSKQQYSILSELFDKFSSYSKILRIIAFCIKFINNCKSKPQKREIGVPVLQKCEIINAEKLCYKWAQHEEFSDEINSLLAGKIIRKSHILSLSPLLDEDNILRVGGRLKNTPCTYNLKHPIILPKHHNLSKAILTYLHHKYLHPTAMTLFHISRQSYWIINGKNLVKEISNACITCFKFRSHPQPQIMGNLPAVRTTPSRPFSKAGVDFAGPIMVANKRGRGAKYTKAYISVFVCMVTKAVHLELVSSLTTESFLAAVRRFTSRRGKPTDIYSDNGTNFKGAWNKINELQSFFNDSQETAKLSRAIATDKIQWHFTPPASPSMGGLWESTVKQVKHHLIRTTINANLTFEEYSTLLCQIEAILNSRPLTDSSPNPNDEFPITPAHFLLLYPLECIPEEDVTEVPVNRLNIWQNIQQRVQGFWKRFCKEYLHTLHQRRKWTHNQENLKPGDLVYITNENTTPLDWPMGKVIDTHPGNDAIVRVVSVKTKSSVMKRPVSKLIKIPID